ncbi:hypothetical protein K431DRAFT_16830 [Polychaeton citri CBS 116435]|uniref:Uncharacterized protein n=1 Tax=Polychaeton citri CBS 116435 TaxID=1314669 RepID=A0A9P4USI4_9PEZI|nr:hypothetical protein K431DRAFT_16830 [Polychaeton citri CBS 116435]
MRLDSRQDGLTRAIRNAVFTGRTRGESFLSQARNCPLWSCHEKVKYGNLVQHLASSHCENELLDGRDRLVTGGLDLSKDDQGQTRVSIPCPVCLNLCQDEGDFVLHMTSAHIVRSGHKQVEHFQAWKHAVVQNSTKVSAAETNYPWRKWNIYLKKRQDRIMCSSCQKSFHTWHSGPQSELRCANLHNLKMMRSNDEIKAELFPHREQILRYWPQFCTHSTFDDLEWRQH